MDNGNTVLSPRRTSCVAYVLQQMNDLPPHENARTCRAACISLSHKRRQVSVWFGRLMLLIIILSPSQFTLTFPFLHLIMVPFATSLLASLLEVPLLVCAAPFSHGLNTTRSASLASASEVAQSSLTGAGTDLCIPGLELGCPPSPHAPRWNSSSYDASRFRRECARYHRFRPRMEETGARRARKRRAPGRAGHLAQGPCGTLSSADVRRIPFLSRLRLLTRRVGCQYLVGTHSKGNCAE